MQRMCVSLTSKNSNKSISAKDSIDEIYANDYSKILNSGAVGLVSNFLHKTLERRLSNKVFPTTLELGAGMGQHFPFVKHQFTTYFETDLRYENLPHRESQKSQVKKLRIDAEKLSEFQDNSVDRVIATCLLIHLSNPENALKEWKRVLRPGGAMQIYIPCEPGMLLRGLRNITTVRKAAKIGVNHLSFHYREHKYSYPHLRLLIQENFADCKVSFRQYPFPKIGWNFNLWTVVDIEKKISASQGEN
jgi:SAM-dependent methyltransferase